MSDKVVVTGASGLLGFPLMTYLGKRGHGICHDFVPLGLHERYTLLDITDKAKTIETIKRIDPELIIHTAAITDVGVCETKPDLAYKVNVQGTENVALAAAAVDARFFYVSTEAVFPGQTGGYTEDETPEPLNTYGRTKWYGELASRILCPLTTVFRLNIFGWGFTRRGGLFNHFFNHLKEGNAVLGYTNVYFAPLLTNTAAVILANHHTSRSLLHLGSHTPISKYHFAVALAKTFGFNPDLVCPTEAKYDTPRPLNNWLDVTLIEDGLNENMPQVETELKKAKDLWDNGYVERMLALEVP